MGSGRNITMTVIKYLAYIGIMVAVIFERNSSFIFGATICSLLISIGSIRQFIIEEKYGFLKKYTFAVDIILVTALGYLKYSGIYIIGYLIIMIEGVFLCPYIVGGILSFVCLISYGGMVWWYYGGVQPLKQILLQMFYNTLAFIFFYAISLSAKKQLEQKEKLEETVGKLKKSKLELEDAYEKLLISNKKIQEYTIVEERNRMAREIHDTLAHTLTTIIVEIEAGKKMFKKGAEGVVEELEKAQNQARIGLDEVRHSVKNLRSGMLYKEGFEGALRITLEQLKAMGEVEIKFHIAEDVVINEEYEMALFRIIQEASTNSCRHGKCNNILIDLIRDEDNILITVSDDGIGCEKIKYGYGILGIKERVKKLGGTIQIESEPSMGFTIRLILPIKEDALVG